MPVSYGRQRRRESSSLSAAEHLERLARFVPGVAGYLDRERARETDKRVRVRLAEELTAVKGALERDKRALIDARDLTPLTALDGLASKLDRLGNTVEYAARGYRPVFDDVKLTRDRLDRLYTFDLGLFDEVTALAARAGAVHAALGDRGHLAEAVAAMDEALDRFGATFAGRQHLLTED